MAKVSRPFQDDYRKDCKTDDIIRQRKQMVTSREISIEKREKIILWNTFYRRNIFVFIQDVLKIKLYPFQIIWIYLMSISPLFVAICSRASSKSFIVAVFVVARSILYPGLVTVVAAVTKQQSGRIIKDKVQWIYNNSEMCKAEIIKITANNNTYEAIFRNGSIMSVVAANEGALGSRCNDLIIDEYAKMDKEVLDNILKPFLIPRQAPFRLKEEYKNISEPVRLYYISSAWYVSEWWYKTAMVIAQSSVEGKSAGFFATDFLTTLKHGLKSMQQMEDEKRDNVAFDIQYGNIPGDSNASAFYPIGFFKRTIQKAFYPLKREEYSLAKNNPLKSPFDIPRVAGEIRIMGVDIATRMASQNDNSVTSCIRLIPTTKGFARNLVYMESSHGVNGIIQANRIKEIWYWFGADGGIAMDVAQAGSVLFDSLSSPYYHEEIDKQLPAFTVMDIPEIEQKTKDEFRSRTLGINAIPIIYPISGNASLNTDMHIGFRASLQKHLWSFLIDTDEAEDFLIRTQKDFFSAEDSAMQSFLLHPYMQTSLFISETVNLSWEKNKNNENIKLDEGSGRKDRYSSVSMANYLASIYDKNLLKEEDDSSDDWSSIYGATITV
jgi:hypothetical protein